MNGLIFIYLFTFFFLFFFNFPNLSQFWLKFEKNLEKSGDLLKIWLKIGPIGIWMGHFFLKILVFIWVYFQIP